MAGALILFAHGARDAAWADPIRRVQAALRAADPAARVELAFLEFLSPTLAESVSSLVAEGFRRIVVLPMFIAQGGHLKRELPEMLAGLRALHPGVDFELVGPVGGSEAVIQAMAAVGLDLLKP